MLRSEYQQQVALLLKVLPIVARSSCFALKGGTAINLFVRNMPRLSVDIDLAYTPFLARTEALNNIQEELLSMQREIKKTFPELTIKEQKINHSNQIYKLFVSNQFTQIKIEPNFILRGSVYPCQMRQLCDSGQTAYEVFIEINSLSDSDLYAGKLCAALDRQHPRDLFDIKLLLEDSGLTHQIRKAFIVYLISHSRPMNELLNPNLIDIKKYFENEFVGMLTTPVTLDDLNNTRTDLIKKLQKELTDEERKFLLSIKSLNPDWKLIGIDGIENLPAVQWKLINLQKIDKVQHQQAVDKLKQVLEI